MLAAFLYFISPRDSENYEPYAWGEELPDASAMAEIYDNVGAFDVLAVTLHSVEEEVVLSHED